jgi:hypothetical protein
MGGKGKPVATNNQMVQMQMQAAADAKQKELQRTANLNQGTSAINALFQGSGGTANTLDLSSLNNQSAANYDPFRVNGTIWNEGTKTWDKDTERQLGNGYSWGVAPPPTDASGNALGKSQYAIYGPDGYAIAKADDLATLAQQKVYTGGTSGGSEGFGPAFYDKFRQSQLDYYLPQEADQYQGARTNLTYSLARAGQLDSSVAGMDVGKLAKQDLMNQAQIASQADNSTAQLRSQVQSEQEAALNQLYATEDPTIAANTASNMVANAQLQKPILNPAGALFAPLVVGVGNALQGFTNPYAYINPTGQSGGGSSTYQAVAQTGSGSGSDQSRNYSG